MQFCSYQEKHGVYLLHSLHGLLRCTAVETEVCGPRQQEISELRADWLITVQSAEESDSPGTVGGTVDYLHPSTKQTHPVVRYMRLLRGLKLKGPGIL